MAYPFFGTHILVDFSCSNKILLNNVESLEAFFNQVCDKANFHIVKKDYHQFDPQGVSMVYILSESHVSIHTWPEFGKASLDVFCCHKLEESTIDIIRKIIHEFFTIESEYFHLIYRGSFPDAEDSYS